MRVLNQEGGVASGAYLPCFESWICCGLAGASLFPTLLQLAYDLEIIIVCYHAEFLCGLKKLHQLCGLGTIFSHFTDEEKGA